MESLDSASKLWTLKQARDYVSENSREGVKCPCCGQFAKVYRRRIYDTMARNLLRLYKHVQGRVHREAHVRDFIPGHPGDFAKLAHWGLICQSPVFDGDKKRSGFWSLTNRGQAFAERQAVINKYALIYNGERLKLEGTYVDIVDCLGKKFSYEEVMAS